MSYIIYFNMIAFLEMQKKYLNAFLNATILIKKATPTFNIFSWTMSMGSLTHDSDTRRAQLRQGPPLIGHLKFWQSTVCPVALGRSRGEDRAATRAIQWELRHLWGTRVGQMPGGPQLRHPKQQVTTSSKWHQPTSPRNNSPLDNRQTSVSTSVTTPHSNKCSVSQKGSHFPKQMF